MYIYIYITILFYCLLLGSSSGAHCSRSMISKIKISKTKKELSIKRNAEFSPIAERGNIKELEERRKEEEIAQLFDLSSWLYPRQID